MSYKKKLFVNSKIILKKNKNIFFFFFFFFIKIIHFFFLTLISNKFYSTQFILIWWSIHRLFIIKLLQKLICRCRQFRLYKLLFLYLNLLIFLLFLAQWIIKHKRLINQFFIMLFIPFINMKELNLHIKIRILSLKQKHLLVLSCFNRRLILAKDIKINFSRLLPLQCLHRLFHFRVPKLKVFINILQHFESIFSLFEYFLIKLLDA